MFDKYLYKTKDDKFVIQFFTKEEMIVNMNVYKKESGSIIFDYSPIYQSIFKSLGIPVAKTTIEVIKNGNKVIDQKPFNPLLKDQPYSLKQVNDNLLLEKFVGQEKEELIEKINNISKSRNNTLTRDKTTTAINSAYLLQGHCYFIEEKSDELYLSRTEVQPTTILVRLLGRPSNGSKTFLKNTESMIPFLFNSLEKENYVYSLTELETRQKFNFFKEADKLLIIPINEIQQLDFEKSKVFNLEGLIIEDVDLLNKFKKLKGIDLNK